MPLIDIHKITQSLRLCVCTFKANSVIAAIGENQQRYRPKCVEGNGTPSRLLNAICYFHDDPSSQGKFVEMAAHSGPYELEQAKDGRLMSSSSVWNACRQPWQRDRRQTELWLNNLSAYHDFVVHDCKTLIFGAHTYTSPYIISIHHQSSSANLNFPRRRLPQPWRSQCRSQLRRQWLRGQRGAWPKASVSGSALSVGCIPYFSSLWGLSSWVAACTAILRYPERLQRMEM